MKFTPIILKNPSAERIYNDYIRRIRTATSLLNKEDQQEILMELNSHIYEHLQQDNQKQEDEVEKLLDVLERLGAPEEILKPLVADKKMEQAVKTFNPVHVFKALMLNITNGLSYVLFSIFYLFLSIFVVLIIMKILAPEQTGLFYHPGQVFVLGITDEKYLKYEVLGNWFIPVMLAGAIIFYLIITGLLKLKRTLKNKIHD